MLGAMAWLPPAYLELDRRIREILAERMEHCATDELDRRPGEAPVRVVQPSRLKS